MKRTLILLTIMSTARAYTNFQIQCTIPPASVHFVSSPESRGTFNILWNCLFTIFACTYTIQHLNIPKQRFNRNPRQGIRGVRDDFTWHLGRFWTSAKWMLITIIAPEFVMSDALGSFIAARDGRRKMKEFAERDGVEWGLSHAFVANMGGFVMRTTSGSPPCEGLEVIEQDKKREIIPKSPNISLRRPVEGAQQVLMGDCLFDLRKSNFIVRLPDITKEEIWGKSKGSLFIQFLATLQVLWNMIQIIARLARGLPIAALEIAVVGFSACAIVTYLLLLQKPLGIEVPFQPLDCKMFLERMSKVRKGRGYPCWAIIADINYNATYTWRDWVAFWAAYPPTLSNFDWTFVPNDVQPLGSVNGQLWGCLLGGSVFGAIHLAAWNLRFTTYLDMLLWRISSSMTTFLMVVFLLFQILWKMIGKYESHEFFLKRLKIMHFAYFVAVLIYVVARIMLLVECFRDLFFLPPAVCISGYEHT